jgi:hypothetical protein
MLVPGAGVAWRRGVKRMARFERITVKDAIEFLQGQDPEALLVCYDPEWGEYPADEMEACVYTTRADDAHVMGIVVERIPVQDTELVRYKAVMVR